MEVTAILLGAVLKPVIFHPDQTFFLPDLARAIQQKYRFVEYPETLEKYNAPSGMEFVFGHAPGVLIGKMTMGSAGFYVEGQASTDAYAAVLDELVEWATGEHSLPASADPLRSTTFFSRLEVKLSKTFAAKFGFLQEIADDVTSAVRSYGMATPDYEPAGIFLHADTLQMGEAKAAKFVLERRAERPYDENIFFSEAPLSTPEHIRLLQRIDDLL